MRLNFGHVSLAFVLKFLNFLQSFVGLSILLYSLWMFNEWDHRVPPPPIPFPLPQPDAFASYLNSINLPAPWFIYDFMGMGILVLCISFLGCIAAEMINGCCLCLYTLLMAVLLLLEASLVGFIAVDNDWEKDLPFDPTGLLDELKSFIEDNIDICTWVGIAVLVVQALSLLLALILRATVSSRREGFDYEDEYDVRGINWEPLLNPQSGQPSGSSKGDNRGSHSDIWSSRMREKYGFNHGDKSSYQA
ncbi:Tetraspanin-18 protein [Spatholobus suberectus]|nr:Tetraspanin-18 protein [Spatholobus suberectus]